MAEYETDLLREQLAVANREIERLRSMLGLSDESADAGRSWEATLFASAEPLPTVDESSPNASKLELFRLLFAGRRDVYALRWANDSTGKSGWSPAVLGGWTRAKSAKPRHYLELTDEVLSAHLRGETAAGIYPLLHGDRTRLLACDFDGKGWALDVLAYVDACRDADVPVALERSRSGDGAHAWTFFAEEIKASTARRLGAGLLRRATARRVELDLASYDQLFPSQDFMPKGSFGNLIALPLAGHARRSGNTMFLDPSSLDPWPDQWAFLSSLHRLSADAAESAASTVGDFDLGPDARGWRQFAVTGGPAAPSEVRAQLGGQLSVERIGLPPSLLAELKHLASLH
ncbi:MAG: TOTE conflict system archaeo-eukaryotic primase domain-containing protein, partial [Candidatus Limnocylindria bacterium]